MAAELLGWLTDVTPEPCFLPVDVVDCVFETVMVDDCERLPVEVAALECDTLAVPDLSINSFA